jgi:hypothetical protein
MKAFRVLVAMAVVALFAATATAERLARQVSDVTPTADPRGGSRILFRWDATLAEGEVAVRRAVLRFTLAGVAQETTLTLRVYPVTAAWSGGQGAVSYDADLWSHAEIDLRQSGTVGVDVTNIVKEIVEEGLTTYGFVIAVDGAGATGLAEGEVARFGGLSTGTMDVVWRRVPARRAGRG